MVPAVVSVEKINNNRNNRIKQQKAERARQKANFRRIICQFESLGEMHRRWWFCADPLADVFLRGIGSIPDRFSNESRGLNAERTSTSVRERDTGGYGGE